MTRGYTIPDPSLDVNQWDGFQWSLPESYNIAEVALDHHPNRTALRHLDFNGNIRSFSYQELDRASDRLAAHMQSTGIEAGDRIAVCLPQCPEHLVIHLAAYKSEAIVVPISMLVGYDTFRYQLSEADVKTLFIDEARKDEIPPKVIEPAHLVYTVDIEDENYDERRGALGALSSEISAATDPTIRSTDRTHPAVILFTSGTSGHPKGVLQGHGYLLGSMPGYHYAFELFTDEDYKKSKLWTPSEWAWAGALFDVVLPTLTVGGTVLSTERRSSFDPSLALNHIEQEAVTHAFFPPTALSRIRTETDPAKYDISSLQVIMCGGEKLPPSLFEWGETTLGTTINETYGQTEANMLVGNCQQLFEAKPGSMGKPFPGHEVTIVDDDGNECPPNELGEIVVDLPDPVAFLEYWGNPEATNEKRQEDERMYTGDLGRRDEDGYLWHAGRIDDMIITSGYRVSPLEVESVLTDNSQVVDAIVGGIPDAERGERVKAYVRLTNGDLQPEDLKQDLLQSVRERLGPHKTPHDIEFIESIPETRSGKTDRDALFSE